MSTESIPVTVNGKVAIVTAPSYVNEKSAEAISEECSGLINDGVSLVLIDMRDCRMVNSVGVAINPFYNAAAAVPEPATLLLALLGLALLPRRRRQSAT